jgi:chromosome segregation ATPase
MSNGGGDTMIERRLAVLENKMESLERSAAELDADFKSLDRLWRSTADDIKAAIKAAIGELKTEQIADLKGSVKEAVVRLDKVERKQDRWDTSAGVVHWFIRGAFAVAGLAAGLLGAEHFK